MPRIGKLAPFREHSLSQEDLDWWHAQNPSRRKAWNLEEFLKKPWGTRDPIYLAVAARDGNPDARVQVASKLTTKRKRVSQTPDDKVSSPVEPTPQSAHNSPARKRSCDSQSNSWESEQDRELEEIFDKFNEEDNAELSDGPDYANASVHYAPQSPPTDTMHPERSQRLCSGKTLAATAISERKRERRYKPRKLNQNPRLTTTQICQTVARWRQHVPRVGGTTIDWWHRDLGDFESLLLGWPRYHTGMWNTIQGIKGVPLTNDRRYFPLLEECQPTLAQTIRDLERTFALRQ